MAWFNVSFDMPLAFDLCAALAANVKRISSTLAALVRMIKITAHQLITDPIVLIILIKMEKCDR